MAIMIRKSPCASTRFTLLGLVLLALATFVVIPHKAKADLIGDEVSFDLAITSFDFSVASGSGVTTVGAGIEVDPIIVSSPFLALDVTALSFELVYDDVVNRAIRKLEFTLGDLNIQVVNATFAINDLGAASGAGAAAASITTTANSVSIVLDETDGKFFVWEIGDRLVVDIEAAPFAPPTSGVLYDIDFNSDIVGGLPQTHALEAPAPRFGPTFTAGSPTVVVSTAPLPDQPVVLDTDLDDDRLQLLLNDFPGGLITDGTVTLEMDLSIGSDGASDGRFEIIFIDDAFNLALDIRFDLLGNVSIGEGGAPPLATTYFADTKIAVRAEINPADDTFVVFLDGISVSSGTFATPLNQIRQITFRVFKSKTTIVTAAIDNVFVSVAFGPPLPTELAKCSLDAPTLAAHCAASLGGFTIFHDLADPFSVPEDCACPAVGAQPAVVSAPCVDVPRAAGACFDPTEDVVITTPSGIEIFNVVDPLLGQTHLSTVYCYAIDGIRICQSFSLPD